MSLSATQIEALQLRGQRLRLELVPLPDRVGHRIWLRETPGGEERLLLESREGTPHEPWPTSPPLQDASLEERPDGSQVLLLVGMAGRSHWSASFQLHPGPPEAIEFDIACRINQPPAQLGSQYFAKQATTASALSAVVGELTNHHPQHEIHCISPETTTQPLKFPTTLRWVYRVTVV